MSIFITITLKFYRVNYNHFIRVFFLGFYLILSFRTYFSVFSFSLNFCLSLFQSWRLVLVENDLMQSVCDQWLWWESWIWRGHKGHLLPGCSGDCWLLGGKTGVRGAAAKDNYNPGLLLGSLFIAALLGVRIRVQGLELYFWAGFTFPRCVATVVVFDLFMGRGRAQGAEPHF